jgi:hypothetical protein
MEIPLAFSDYCGRQTEMTPGSSGSVADRGKAGEKKGRNPGGDAAGSRSIRRGKCLANEQA